jgi:hypothetical protein
MVSAMEAYTKYGIKLSNQASSMLPERRGKRAKENRVAEGHDQKVFLSSGS